jgi:hypothetical protein
VTKRKPAPPPPAAKRGRGRPSNAEKARLAAEALMARAVVPETPEVSDMQIRAYLETLMTLSGPPEPDVKPVLPPPPPPPPPAPAPKAEQDLSELSTYDRSNPEKLWGEALRHFAWQRGIARSEMADWPDEKVRQQVSILIRRQYNELAEV